MTLREWYDSTAGTHAGPEGCDMFVDWCRHTYGIEIEKMRSELWPGFLGLWLGVELTMIGDGPPSTYVQEIPGVIPTHPSPVGDGELLHCTAQEFLSAIFPVVRNELMKATGQDGQSLEDQTASMLLSIIRSLEPYWSSDS